MSKNDVIAILGRFLGPACDSSISNIQFQIFYFGTFSCPIRLTLRLECEAEYRTLKSLD
jgi:hypothetical protein